MSLQDVTTYLRSKGYKISENVESMDISEYVEKILGPALSSIEHFKRFFHFKETTVKMVEMFLSSLRETSVSKTIDSSRNNLIDLNEYINKSLPVPTTPVLWTNWIELEANNTLYKVNNDVVDDGEELYDLCMTDNPELVLFYEDIVNNIFSPTNPKRENVWDFVQFGYFPPELREIVIGFIFKSVAVCVSICDSARLIVIANFLEAFVKNEKIDLLPYTYDIVLISLSLILCILPVESSKHLNLSAKAANVLGTFNKRYSHVNLNFVEAVLLTCFEYTKHEGYTDNAINGILKLVEEFGSKLSFQLFLNNINFIIPSIKNQELYQYLIDVYLRIVLDCLNDKILIDFNDLSLFEIADSSMLNDVYQKLSELGYYQKSENYCAINKRILNIFEHSKK